MSNKRMTKRKTKRNRKMKGGSTQKKMNKMNKRSKRSKRVMRGGSEWSFLPWILLVIAFASLTSWYWSGGFHKWKAGLRDPQDEETPIDETSPTSPTSPIPSPSLSEGHWKS